MAGAAGGAVVHRKTSLEKEFFAQLKPFFGQRVGGKVVNGLRKAARCRKRKNGCFKRCFAAAVQKERAGRHKKKEQQNYDPGFHGRMFALM